MTLLAEDHRTVDKIFNEFERIANSPRVDAEKAELVRNAGAALVVHATIEEDVLYPALREASAAGNELDAAEVEHATIRSLVSRPEEMQPADELYDARAGFPGDSGSGRPVFRSAPCFVLR